MNNELMQKVIDAAIESAERLIPAEKTNSLFLNCMTLKKSNDVDIFSIKNKMIDNDEYAFSIYFIVSSKEINMTVFKDTLDIDTSIELQRIVWTICQKIIFSNNGEFDYFNGSWAFSKASEGGVKFNDTTNED